MKRQADEQLTLSVDAFGGESVNREIGARMKAARAALGLTQPAFAEAIGGSKPGIQDNEAGKTMPGGKVLYGFVRAGINANWLLTGEGPMLMEDLQRQGGADQEAARTEVTELQARVDKLVEERARQLEVMRDVVKILEEELVREDMDLTPDAKAQVVAILYEYAVKAGALDTSMLRSVLALAA